ncbi:septal ring lytic transglycosylase RlpA family protein [Bradyrhizobium sp.]|jgi:peptidoglycan lytic transglycosylase|uniref:septal ring lytic transglycosylase RlpA family protein n=1 Tax=Bradyrhizobium sp. TaxID=376 RepID=UPI002D6EAD02|nr:septal ring lytic transglycosylase RlpA family protein [Bradyrhizobium sp.]HZR75622.1 septal ring lytic transglycosylase RlpA family protein [Bradyrhizobium sp.]
MLKLNKQALGRAAQSRTALILFAAAAFTGGTVSEASARSYRHHHHHYSHHVARAETSSWREANASISPSFGGHSFSGMASFYGNESGRQTASGQRFNQEAMTAAHRSLPFGTKLRVTHGGRSVVVTINDRGPFVRGRVLDLSTGAARAIGLTSAGVGRVTAEVI